MSLAGIESVGNSRGGAPAGYLFAHGARVFSHAPMTVSHIHHVD